MKLSIAATVLLLFPLSVYSQDISGLWKGSMYNDATKKSLPYELLINKEKGKYTGFSQTWFLIGEKEYYGIKKVKITVAKDGKIVIRDAALIEHNYPVRPGKNISQLDILDLVSRDNEDILDGPFVTNLTKRFGGITGHINLKKADTFSGSSLLQYLDKKGLKNDVAVVK